MRLGLIIGAMKSGTTSLFEYLAQHPAICASRPKEPGYFSEPDGSHDDAWYLGCWAFDPERHRVRLEASTHYTKLPRDADSPARAARFAAEHGFEVRLVYIMRHPLERIESQLRHAAEHTPERLLERRARIVEQAIAYSSYARQLTPWTERFGRDNLLLLSFEELGQAPDAVVRRVCAFLGVDPSHPFVDLHKAYHVTKRRDPRLNVLARSQAFGRWWRLLPSAWRQRLKGLADRLGQRRRPYLDADERRFAAARLVPEMAALRDGWGFDTSIWRLEP
ncbi:MAG: sulfotransferase [Myxococcota bacterium]